MTRRGKRHCAGSQCLDPYYDKMALPQNGGRPIQVDDHDDDDDGDDGDDDDDNKMVISQNKGLILEMGGFSFQLNFMLFL